MTTHQGLRCAFATILGVGLALTAGCSLDLDPPEGVLACTADTECPATWTCRADARCWRTPGEGTDAGMIDAGRVDAQVSDAGMIDAQVSDAAPDAPTDAFVPECAIDDDCDDGDDNPCTGVPTCEAGVCVDGAPVVCDDGIDCTDDVCMPSDGSCQSTPNDALCTGTEVCRLDLMACAPAMACPAVGDCPSDGLYCNGLELCSAGLCSSPGRDCDDGNNCTIDTCNEAGMACSTTPYAFATDVDHCGTGTNNCVVCGAAPAGATRACTSGSCGFTCNAGRVDLDGIAANGCECMITSAVDEPDVMGIDSNCDGIDGDRARAIYVSAGGAPTGDGSMPSAPVTLGRAHDIFVAMPARDQILVQVGSYTTTLPFTLRSGMRLHGGYSSDYRTRGTTHSAVLSTATSALVASSITSPTVIDRIDWQTTDRTTGPSITMVFTSSVNVLLRDVVVRAGNGGPGFGGSSGSDGARGDDGDDATLGSTGAGGTAVVAGGGGGMAGRGNISGPTGGLGGGGSTCGAGGSGGGWGMPLGTCTVTAGMGMEGSRGCEGTNGPPGNGGNGVGALSSTTWRPSDGAPGMPGANGSGGGGGGGGAGAVCTSGGTTNMADGGAGGGGGGGGGGAVPGGPGAGGAASIGILLIGSDIAVERLSITTGDGGNGGAGGAGGVGGPGGAPGRGGLGTSVGGAVGGDGGGGGPGGRGGHAGCGGGGGGGPSIGIYGNGVGSAIVRPMSPISFALGTGGTGGSGCTSASTGAMGARMNFFGVSSL